MKYASMFVLFVLLLPGVTRSQMKVEGARAEILAQFADAEKKIMSLAEAIPEEKYGWRPMEGVRSVSEVYMHLVGSNLFFPRLVGVESMLKYERGMEKSVTTKADVLDWLKQSFTHARKAVEGTADKDLDKATKIFGQDGTYRGVFILMATHMHEHLGQSIAYARMNQVVPPWSMRSE